MDPRALKIEDFTYNLPKEKIAQYPLKERDESKLLIFEHGVIKEDIYKNIAHYLDDNTTLVFNQTKVMPVRLFLKKETSAKIEIFCLEPSEEYSDMHSAMMQKGSVNWQCLVGGAQKWKENTFVFFEDLQQSIRVEARILSKKDGYFVIHFDWNQKDLCFAELLLKIGNIPLPPYMNRHALQEDSERYQTIYATNEGSVAAPTAGLHFTNNVMDSLKKHNIDTAFLTLHVGAGTFKPVKTKTIGAHDMHSEWIEIDISFLEKIYTNIGNIVAVGTTSIRCLESLYWIGVKLYHNIYIEWGHDAVKQWDPYNISTQIDAKKAIGVLVEWMKAHNKSKIITRTSIIIAPDYKVRVVQGLITNFHQPQSTLLLLVAALIGQQWHKVYQYALEHNYRFLSYGDGCLLKF